MEDYALDVMIGKGPSARSLRLSLKPFTIVGATTRAGRISSPLRDRFGATYRLDFYDLADLTAIVERSARLLGVELSPDGAAAIARRGRGTPRVVNRLLRRVRDYAQINGDGRVDAATADKALAALEIDDAGPGRDGPQAAGRDRPEVRQRAGGSAGPGRGSGGGAGDGRGRLRAVPAAAGVPGSDAAGPHRHGRRPAAPGAPRATKCRRRAAAMPTSPRSGMARPTPTHLLADDRRTGSLAGPSRFAGLAGSLRGGRAAARRRVHSGAGRPADAAPRGGGDAPVHAGRHQRDGEGALARRSSRGRRHDHPGQHLPPLPAPRSRAHRPPRRPAQLHGLGPAAPHRLGRVPGRVDGRAAQDRRRGRHLPEPSRRLVPSLHARAFDRRPGGARRRHRRRLRPARTARLIDPGSRRGGDGSHSSLGRTFARGAHATGPGSLRHRPGRPRSAASGRVHELHGGPAVRRHLHRRPGRRRDARPAGGGADRRHRPACATIRGRAT